MEDAGGDVVVVGAGFSRAVHAAFPVLSELSGLVATELAELKPALSTEGLLAELRDSHAGPGDVLGADCERSTGPGVDFEAWLSRIAEDQPHLSSEENLERRALYARSATAIRRVLLEAERQAFDSRVVERWPYELMRVLDARRATVITMNYDQVIERLAGQALWVEGGVVRDIGLPPGRKVAAADLFDGLPPQGPESVLTRLQSLPGGVQLTRVRPADTLRLLKLHGSVSWFAAPNDPTGLTMAHWAPGEAEADMADDENLRRRHLPGREPFLVPPSTRKSPYLENPVIREVWYRARRALESTRRMAVVGYSLPATDTIFGGMLADTLANRNVEVTVVNTSPKPVVAQLRRLGVKASTIDVIGGEHAVRDWTCRLVDRQATVVAAELQHWTGMPDRAEEKLVVSVVWASPAMPGTVAGGQYQRQVRSPGVHLGTDLVLELRPQDKGEVDDLWPIGDLGSHLERACRLVVDVGGRRPPIIDWKYRPAINSGQAGTVDLYPATVPADWADRSNGEYPPSE